MNISDLKRNAYMLRGSDAKRGYMRWWHSFQGVCRIIKVVEGLPNLLRVFREGFA